MTADQSRKQALRCLQAAEQSNTPKLKAVLLAEAAAWDRLAAEQEQAETKKAIRRASKDDPPE
jgi:hypothetical protein